MTASRWARPWPTSARCRPTKASSMVASRRFSQRRRSVATWSLRERPVWSLPATGPMRSARAISMLRWMSSSAGSQAMVPACTSASRPRRPSPMAAASASSSRPAARSPETWASEPRMSSMASSASTSMERPKSAASASGSAEKRPPQAFMGGQAGGAAGSASATLTGSSPSIGCVHVQAESCRAASVRRGRPKMRMKPTDAAWS